MTTNATTATAKLTYAVPNSPVTVALYRTDAGQTWRVETTTNGQLVDDWTRSYPTEAEARAEARRAAQAFKVHLTVAGVERRANELGIVIQQQEARKVRRMCNHAALDAAYAEQDALMPLGLAAHLRNNRHQIAA